MGLYNDNAHDIVTIGDTVSRRVALPSREYEWLKAHAARMDLTFDQALRQAVRTYNMHQAGHDQGKCLFCEPSPSPGCGVVE